METDSEPYQEESASAYLDPETNAITLGPSEVTSQDNEDWYLSHHQHTDKLANDEEHDNVEATSLQNNSIDRVDHAVFNKYQLESRRSLNVPNAELLGDLVDAQKDRRPKRRSAPKKKLSKRQPLVTDQSITNADDDEGETEADLVGDDEAG